MIVHFFLNSLDASLEDKSLGRLVNDEHKNPNCKMQTIQVDNMPHLCLFAIRDIVPGEEVTYNYGDSDWPWRKQVWKHATGVCKMICYVSAPILVALECVYVC